METFTGLLEEISAKQNFLNISLIEQINLNIYDKLINLFEEYKNTNNKYLFVSKLVKFGYNLEITFCSNSTDILSLQMNSISGLIEPIISRIRKICFELNLELVDDLKKNIQVYIDEDKKLSSDVKKQIKLINVNCFCRNVNYVISKELMFEDFGIVIKISNPHYKKIFSELVESIGIFTPNDGKDKRFDWYWKALHNYNLDQVSSDELNVYGEPNINKCENWTNLSNESIDAIESTPTSTITSTSTITNMPALEEFKIVQKIPENIESTNKNKIIKNATGENFKILSKLTIIDDDSFSIPIDNIE